MKNSITKIAHVFDICCVIRTAIRLTATALTYPVLHSHSGIEDPRIQLLAFYHSNILLFACKPKNPV